MRLTLYSRRHCHLCSDMLNSLQEVWGNLNFELDIIDIDEQQQFKSRFDTEVPVLTSGDDIICRHFYDDQLIREYLSTHG